MDVTSHRHLFVDGANILHAWPELRALMKRNRDAARSQLVHLVSVIHDEEQVTVTIVFDGRGTELVVERPSNQETFRVVYTPSAATADDVIEQWVTQSTYPEMCVVATGDRAEAQTITASGASVVSPDDLAAWAERALSRQRVRMAKLGRQSTQGWREP